ncbi:unnamed protein product [Amoebophrya sp. A120]|nr:unnamed protein product [Amoebophrya sp. A120]|eukprot:GSA120T00003087001.1
MGGVDQKMSSEEKVQKLCGTSPDPTAKKISLENATKQFVDGFLANTLKTHPYACCEDAKTERIIAVTKKWQKLYLCKEDPRGKKVKEVTQRNKYHNSVFKENGLSSFLKNPTSKHEWVGEEVWCEDTDELLFFFKRPKISTSNGALQWDMNSVNEATRCLFVGQNVLPAAAFREAHSRTYHIPGEGKTCSTMLSVLLAENRDGSNPLVYLTEPMVETIMADHEADWFFDTSLPATTYSQGLVN